MKGMLAGVAIMLTTPVMADDIVSLSFYKDSCSKFLQSEPADQAMYVAWASGHIKREFGVDLDSAALSQPLQSYCAANPATTFVDATTAVKSQLAPVKP